MKKVFLIFLILLTACTSKPSETLLLKCQKLRSYEFYDGTNIIGVYGNTNQVSKVEVVENYTPKWEDVEIEKLREQLEVHKRELQKQYSNLIYKIDVYRRDLTTDISIPLSSENITKMKEDPNYQDSIVEDKFSLETYRSLLENNGYICE